MWPLTATFGHGWRTTLWRWFRVRIFGPTPTEEGTAAGSAEALRFASTSVRYLHNLGLGTRRMPDAVHEDGDGHHMSPLEERDPSRAAEGSRFGCKMVAGRSGGWWGVSFPPRQPSHGRKVPMMSQCHRFLGFARNRCVRVVSEQASISSRSTAFWICGGSLHGSGTADQTDRVTNRRSNPVWDPNTRGLHATRDRETQVLFNVLWVDGSACR